MLLLHALNFAVRHPAHMPHKPLACRTIEPVPSMLLFVANVHRFITRHWRRCLLHLNIFSVSMPFGDFINCYSKCFPIISSGLYNVQLVEVRTRRLEVKLLNVCCISVLFAPYSGLVIAERSLESPKLPNFRHKPAHRNYRPTIAPEPLDEEEEDYKATPECPESEGFFVHPEQCDKYYACR